MFSRILFSISILVIFLFMNACKSDAVKKGGDGSDSTKIEDVNTSMEEKKQEPSVMTYRVSLGVMPDANYKGKGMLVGHVNEGKPGKAAGILKGDIIIEMDGKEINDLVSYTRALGSYDKGDQVKVTLKRGEELMNVLVEF
jgi:S1-C subfamily serine protease